MIGGVIKSNGWDVYHVRANHEWATIVIKGWQATYGAQPREVGEILIHSSYGSWAHQWGHLGEPFKAWIATCNDRDYIAQKFMGSKAYVFDGPKTVREMRQSLLEHRKTGDITKADARAIWDWVDENEYELESGANRFIERMLDCAREADWPPRNGLYGDASPFRGARHFLEEPWERIATSLDHSFARFWEVLMHPFQQALLKEMQPDKEPS